MREVGQLGGAEDQGEPDGGEGQDDAEDQPVDGELGDLAPQGCPRGRDALAQREEDGLALARERQHLFRRLIGICQGDALRQGRLVERDRVIALTGHHNRPLAFGIRFSGFPEARRLNEHLDPRNALRGVWILDGAADQGVVRKGGGAQGKPAGGDQAHNQDENRTASARTTQIMWHGR